MAGSKSPNRQNRGYSAGAESPRPNGGSALPVSPANSVLELTVLGSGTSMGVPTLTCHCRVCSSKDPRDNRMRPSVLLVHGGRTAVIDTTPDFRTPALRVGLERVGGVLFPHTPPEH